MLDNYLARCYQTAVVKNSDPAGVLSALKKRLDANNNLRIQAQKKLSELSDEVTKRCFISKKYRHFLETALNGSNE